MCSIHNSIEPISQAIGFFYCLRVSEFHFDACLGLQSSDELVEDLTLRKAVDLHCQGCENGDIFKDRTMLPEVCPFVLETSVFVGWHKVLFHAGTKCWPCQRCCRIPVLAG